MYNFDEKEVIMGLLYIIRPQYSTVPFSGKANKMEKDSSSVTILRDPGSCTNPAYISLKSVKELETLVQAYNPS
jgi:hypothetical protein